MFEIETTKDFRRKFTKLIKNNKKLELKVIKTIEQLRLDPRYPSLKTHKVDLPKSGTVYSSWVSGDMRIIWKQVDKTFVLLLIDIGGHSGSGSVY